MPRGSASSAPRTRPRRDATHTVAQASLDAGAAVGGEDPESPEDVVAGAGERGRGAAPPRRRRRSAAPSGPGWPPCSPRCGRARPVARPTGTPAPGVVTSTPARPCASSCAGWASPARSRGGTGALAPRRVVLLVDVSGSMSAYADALLRLAHTYAAAGLPVEVFTLGTRLTHVTRPLRQRDPERAIVACGAPCPTGRAAPGWPRASRCSSTGGASRHGAGRGRRRVQRRLGARRARGARRADAPAARPRPPGRLGQPAPRQAGLRAGAAGDRRGAAAR